MDRGAVDGGRWTAEFGAWEDGGVMVDGQHAWTMEVDG